MKRRKGEREKEGRSPIPRPVPLEAKGFPSGFTDSPIHFQTGFTILEAMIALVILSIALLALLRVMPVGIKGSKLAEETTTATMLAQKKIEKTRAAGYPGTGTTDGTFAAPNDNFDWEMTVSNPGISYLRTVDVSVYWPAPLGNLGNRSGQRCVGIKTYVADYSK